jgi:hypothetical protein
MKQYGFKRQEVRINYRHDDFGLIIWKIEMDIRKGKGVNTMGNDT